MKIAVVCPYDLGLAGGVQQLTTELVDRLCDAGHDAWLVGPGERPGARTVGGTVRLRANASVVPVGIGPRTRARTRAAVAGADVVHVHEPLIPRVGTAARRGSVPRVLTFHADPPAWVRRLYRLADRPLAATMTGAAVTAVSTVAAAAIPARWGPVEIIPNALDVAAYAGDHPREPRRVTFLGRDDPRKGLDVLLAAWSGIQARVPGAELLVLGASRDTSLPGVRFLGRVADDEKRRLLASSTVHVAPNTGGESFGIVVAEAMAAGCAVVASTLPAFVEVMGGSGIGVPVGDAASLRDAVVDLLEDPARARERGAAAQIRAAAFDWPHVTEQYLAAYRRALG